MITTNKQAELSLFGRWAVNAGKVALGSAFLPTRSFARRLSPVSAGHVRTSQIVNISLVGVHQSVIKLLRLRVSHDPF